ncbi:transmembrane protein C16orf54 homolog isoform X1 [Lontra canadensis]|uniref:transmembrane protein C16orf54 homolog isoform X1 n=1 Tax=Lontra canadensis TaxID=76717 RepID=UPI0013F35B78|nr:transmembrane protein C16orf54 homolog isoform X1 [Lontra canadensis]
MPSTPEQPFGHTGGLPVPEMGSWPPLLCGPCIPIMLALASLAALFLLTTAVLAERLFRRSQHADPSNHAPTLVWRPGGELWIEPRGTPRERSEDWLRVDRTDAPGEAQKCSFWLPGVAACCKQRGELGVGQTLGQKPPKSRCRFRSQGTKEAENSIITRLPPSFLVYLRCRDRSAGVPWMPKNRLSVGDEGLSRQQERTGSQPPGATDHTSQKHTHRGQDQAKERLITAQLWL